MSDYDDYLADVQITQEEAIAAMLFLRYQGEEVHEEMAQDVGRSALLSTVQNLSVEDFAALKEVLNG